MFLLLLFGLILRDTERVQSMVIRCTADRGTPHQQAEDRMLVLSQCY